MNCVTCGNPISELRRTVVAGTPYCGVCARGVEKQIKEAETTTELARQRLNRRGVP